SVLVIEHDTESIMWCEHVIDIGPGGVSQGGEIEYNGPIQNFRRSKRSVTAKMLDNPPKSEVNRSAPSQHSLEVVKSSCNNINSLSVKIPLQQLVTVAGVSGAGKSSLVHGIIVNTLQNGKEKGERWLHDGNTVKST